MATHGFIDLRTNGEEVKDRTLIHACHDGYVSNMIEDLITLPYYMAHNLKKETYLDESIVPDFLKGSNYNHRHYIYKMFGEGEFKSYEQLLSRWSSTIPLDDTRYSIASYLIGLRPDMYEIAAEPFILYGHAVTDADINIVFDDNRLNSAIIKLDYQLEDGHNWEEMEHVVLIKNINELLLTEEDAKIKVLNEGKTIIINFDKFIVDLFYHKKI